MDEKMAREYILNLSKTLKKEEFASLVSYFSLTKGKGKKEIPNLSLFPKLSTNKDIASLRNRVKSELNYLGVSITRFNQGTSILSRVLSLNNSDIHFDLLQYINTTNHEQRWLGINDNNFYTLVFSKEDKGCFCTTDLNNRCRSTSSGDRVVNIDLISLAKIAQSIFIEINLPEQVYVESFETLIHTVILHEYKHLTQRNLDNTIQGLRNLRRSKKCMKITKMNASEFIKFYLRYEYDAWTYAYQKDANFYRSSIITKALCNMSLTSYITEMLKDVYFKNKLTFPHEDTTFEISNKILGVFK